MSTRMEDRWWNCHEYYLWPLSSLKHNLSSIIHKVFYSQCELTTENLINCPSQDHLTIIPPLPSNSACYTWTFGAWYSRLTLLWKVKQPIGIVTLQYWKKKQSAIQYISNNIIILMQPKADMARGTKSGRGTKSILLRLSTCTYSWFYLPSKIIDQGSRL